VLPHGLGCAPAETTRRDNRCRRTTSVCAAVRPRGRVPALVRTVWARPGAAADRAKVNSSRAADIPRGTGIAQGHRNGEVRDECAGAPQAKPRLNARRVHVRPPHTADADMTQQAACRQEMPKLKAQLESQACTACVVQTATNCTPLATCRIRRTLRPPSRAVSDLRLSRVRLSCAQEREPVKLRRQLRQCTCGAKHTGFAVGLLLRAAEKGNLAALTECLEDGEDVTQTASNRNTALHWAAFRGRSTAWRT
jgi:hypothetical protein